MFKIILLITALAYASAGYAGVEQSYAVPAAAAYYSSAPAVSYSTVTRHHGPSLPYTAPAHNGYALAAPVLSVPNQAYTTTPFTGTYAAQAYSYGHNSYAPTLSYGNYGHSAYAAPLATKTVALVQPQLYQQNTYASHAIETPVLATRGFNYAPVSAGAQLLGYNNHHGHYAY